jgi:hypothetical protein
MALEILVHGFLVPSLFGPEIVCGGGEHMAEEFCLPNGCQEVKKEENVFQISPSGASVQ